MLYSWNCSCNILGDQVQQGPKAKGRGTQTPILNLDNSFGVLRNFRKRA